MLQFVHPTNLPSCVDQVPLSQPSSHHVQLHAASAVLAVGGPAFAVAAAAVGGSQISLAVELTRFAQVGLLRFETCCFEHFKWIIDRISIAVIGLHNVIRFVTVSILGMNDNIFLLLYFHTNPAFNLLLEAFLLMFLDCRQLPGLSAMLAFDWITVNFLSQRRLFDSESFLSTEGTLQFFVLGTDDVEIASSAVQLSAFGLLALHCLFG